jgi:hypothetical protein
MKPGPKYADAFGCRWDGLHHSPSRPSFSLSMGGHRFGAAAHFALNIALRRLPGASVLLN